jgi:nitroreductase/NAD-dependent dihydropyrimidine dehydrogenase PreA subunit
MKSGDTAKGEDMEFHGEESICTGCGHCVETCPEVILELSDKRPRFAEGGETLCIRCGHCVMVCAPGAARHSAFGDVDFEPVDKGGPDFASLCKMLKTRRSVRRFKEQPVPRGLIDQILEATALAPMGFPPHTTEVIVFDDRDKIQELVPHMMKDYGVLRKNMSNPIGRFFVRRAVGAPLFCALERHVIPVTARSEMLFNERNLERYLWGAPALLLFHADRFEASNLENTWIAVTYAMLAAHASGLGTLVNGLLPPIANRSKELRKKLDIPHRNEVQAALLLGFPKYSFHRSVKRRLKAVKYM